MLRQLTRLDAYLGRHSEAAVCWCVVAALAIGLVCLIGGCAFWGDGADWDGTLENIRVYRCVL